MLPCLMVIVAYYEGLRSFFSTFCLTPAVVWVLLPAIHQRRFHTRENYMHPIYGGLIGANLLYFITQTFPALPSSDSGADFMLPFMSFVRHE